MGTRQDQILRFGVEVASDPGLLKIATDLDAIVKAGGPAAAAAQELLDKLKLLASQNTAADGLAGMKANLLELGDSFTSARLKVEQLEAQFDAAEVPTTRLTNALTKARASVTALQDQFNLQQAAVAKAENALASAGLSTEGLDAAQRKLQASLAGTTAEGQALAASFREGAAAAQQEAASLSEVAEKSTFLRGAIEQVKTLLLTFAGFFVLEKVKEDITGILETGDKFAKFGLDFANAFGGAKAGEEALAKVKELADQTPLSLEQVAAAAIKARKEGLDPFDGTLLALIDTNAKFGGSVDNLNVLIDVLGKATARGAITTRQLVELQQQGIPVTQILGKELGKTADEILDMAKKGEIGRESIKLLITELGKGAAGDASTQMNLLGTLVVKVKDQWEEFLNLIGKSGAYDFVRDKLKEINEAFKAGLADGSLRDKAQALSNVIVGFGQAVASTAKFISDHATAIFEAARGYVVFKAAILAMDLAGATVRMLGLAAATKEAGAAAELAAAETGAFGKLGAKIASIPKGIQIAVVAAGADFVIGQITQILEISEKIAQQNRDDKKSLQELIDTREVLAARAAIVASRLKEFSNVQIADASKLASLTRDQADEYTQQLQNATRYFTALKIQADAAGNFKGVQEASAHLRELGLAQQAAADHLKVAIENTGEAVATIVDRFDKLATQGRSAAESIEGAFKKIELANPVGLQTALDIIGQVSIRSRDAKLAVQSELVGALEKLDAIDLRDFEEKVSKRIKDAAGNVDALKIALQAGLEADLLKLGLSAQQAGVDFTVGGQKIIDTFTNIATSAASTAAQVQLAFAKALSQASTQGEVEALRDRLQAAFDAGKIGASQLQAGMEAVGRKLTEVQVAAATAGASLDGMATDGVSAAQRISSALQDTRDKLVVHANDIARAITNALSTGDDKTANALRAEFRAVDTEIQGLNGQIDTLNNKLEKTAKSGIGAAAAIEAAQAAAFNASQRANLEAEASAKSADKAQTSFTEWGDAADKTAVALGHATANTAHANDGMNDLAGGIAAARTQFLGVSDAAAKAYDTILKGAFDLGHTNDGSGFDRVARAMNIALEQVNQEVADNRKQLQEMVATFDQYGKAGSAAFDATAQSANMQLAIMRQTSAAIQDGTFQLGLLGKADLAPLQAALDAAIQRAQALKDAADAATQSLVDAGQALQDQLDQAAGDNTAIENRRFQKQLDDLKKLAAAAGAAGQQQFNDDIAKANALHQLKLKQIADQEAAQAKANGNSGGSNPPAAPTPSGGGRGSGSNGSGGGGGIPPQTASHTFNVVLLGADENAKQQFLRFVKQGLADIGAKSV